MATGRSVFRILFSNSSPRSRICTNHFKCPMHAWLHISRVVFRTLRASGGRAPPVEPQDKEAIRYTIVRWGM